MVRYIGTFSVVRGERAGLAKEVPFLDFDSTEKCDPCREGDLIEWYR